MSKLPKIYSLKDEAKGQLYHWFDREIHALPKKTDGQIDPVREGLVDNDVDAMRHAFVSGVYTMEFGEDTAELLGRLNEWGDFDSGPNAKGAENMDLWNNAVVRETARKAKNRRHLFELLVAQMKAGALILSPTDKKKYKGQKFIKRKPKAFVIKLKKTKTGANIVFLDVRTRKIMSKARFMAAIRRGEYPGYAIKTNNHGTFPYSTRDKFNFNNLG